MNHVDPGHHLEQFARDMIRAPVSRRCHVEFTGIGFGVGDELGNRCDWKRWMHHHNKSIAADGCDRRDVANEIETKLVVERRVDDVRRTCHEEGVAVRRRPHDRLGANVAAPTWPAMTNGWPSRSDSHCAIRRATMSVAPPAASGTIRRTGRVGKACARAIRDAAGSAAAPAASCRTYLRSGSFIGIILPDRVLHARNRARARGASVDRPHKCPPGWLEEGYVGGHVRCDERKS